MPPKKVSKTPIKVGDFVFAKLTGYRAWPARVLEATNGRYHIYFYGTCNTSKVSRNQIHPYEQHKNRFGNVNKPKISRKSIFRLAMGHVELVYADPTNDFGYFQRLKAIQGQIDNEELGYGSLDESSEAEDFPLDF